MDVAVGSSNGCNSNSPRVELRNHLYPSTYIFARAVLQENAPGSPRRVFERTSLGGRFDNENNFDDPREGFALARSAPIAEPKRAPKDRQVLRAESQWEKRRDHRRALCIENECCHSAIFAATASSACCTSSSSASASAAAAAAATAAAAIIALTNACSGRRQSCAPQRLFFGQRFEFLARPSIAQRRCRVPRSLRPRRRDATRRARPTRTRTAAQFVLQLGSKTTTKQQRALRAFDRFASTLARAPSQARPRLVRCVARGRPLTTLPTPACK